MSLPEFEVGDVSKRSLVVLVFYSYLRGTRLPFLSRLKCQFPTGNNNIQKHPLQGQQVLLEQSVDWFAVMPHWRLNLLLYPWCSRKCLEDPYIPYIPQKLGGHIPLGMSVCDFLQE